MCENYLKSFRRNTFVKLVTHIGAMKQGYNNSNSTKGVLYGDPWQSVLRTELLKYYSRVSQCVITTR